MAWTDLFKSKKGPAAKADGTIRWFGKLPTAQQLADFKAQLASERKLPAEVIAFLRGLKKDAIAMDVLRTGVSMLGLYDADAADMSEAANVRKAIRLTSQIATLVAAAP